MPLVKRDIEPQYISRVVVPTGVRNDLEFVANATLGHVVAQLSSLSKHAEDLFTELHRDASCIFYRSYKLNERIDRLKQKIQQLNPVKETVSLQDMNLRKPFKSSVTKEQQILTLHSRPQAIIDRYKEIETPPPLNKLDAYREDGKDSLKFYTDPEYFLELWCQEMVKDADNQHKKQKNRNKRARPAKEPRTIRAPKSHLEEFKDRRHGPEFVGLSIGKEPPIYGNISVGGQPLNRPVSLEISTPVQPNQWDIVGHGFPTAEYGLVMAGTLPRSGSVADSNSGPVSQNTLPGYRSESVDLYPVDQIGSQNHAGGQSNRSTPSKQAKQLASDSSLRQHRNHYGEGGYMSVDGRVQTGRDTMSPRPALPPPAPPDSTEQRRGTPQAVRTASVVNRDNLPPPPPTPVQQVARSESAASKSGRRPYSPANYGGQEQAPTPTSPKGMFNNSFELPPPPTPPPLNMEMIPSPPSIPPPPMEDAFSPPPPPLPPPLALGSRLNVRKDVKVVPEWENNNDLAPVDSTSLASDTSSATVSSKAEEKPAIRDTRSDLLSAIRTGINLRKVEERRLKTEQKQGTTAKGFDVQAIMEAAFERRRKALEENDSDRDDDEDVDGNWSDDG